jgi:hypothetical protein
VNFTFEQPQDRAGDALLGHLDAAADLLCGRRGTPLAAG